MLRYRLTLGLATALAAGALAGCLNTPGPSIFITGNVSPDDMCLYKTSNPLVLRAVFDVDRPDKSYLFVPKYSNQMLHRESTGPFRADPNGFQVHGAEITLVDQSGATIGFPGLPNPFTVMAGDYVPPGTTTGPGEAIGAIDAIPQAYGDVMRAVVGDNGTISAEVQVFGETNGGYSVDGITYQLPINLCAGCLRICLSALAMGETGSSCPNGTYVDTGC